MKDTNVLDGKCFPNDQKVNVRLDLAEIQTLETLDGQVMNYPEKSKEKENCIVMSF